VCGRVEKIFLHALYVAFQSNVVQRDKNGRSLGLQRHRLHVRAEIFFLSADVYFQSGIPGETLFFNEFSYTVPHGTVVQLLAAAQYFHGRRIRVNQFSAEITENNRIAYKTDQQFEFAFFLE